MNNAHGLTSEQIEAYRRIKAKYELQKKLKWYYAFRDEYDKVHPDHAKRLTAWDGGRILRLDGGPGSGNHNHEGRPGKVGGSAPSNSAGSVKTAKGRMGDFRKMADINALVSQLKDGDTFQYVIDGKTSAKFIIEGISLMNPDTGEFLNPAVWSFDKSGKEVEVIVTKRAEQPKVYHENTTLVQDVVGCSKERASEIARAFDDYTDLEYYEDKMRIAMDEYIHAAPTVAKDTTLYRGVYFGEHVNDATDDKDRLLDGAYEAYYEATVAYDDGAVLTSKEINTHENAVTSWSTSEAVADGFGGGRGKDEANWHKGPSIKFICTSNKTGADVSKLSSHSSEDEIIKPSEAKYRVIKTKTHKNAAKCEETVVWLEEI